MKKHKKSMGETVKQQKELQNKIKTEGRHII